MFCLNFIKKLLKRFDMLSIMIWRNYRMLRYKWLAVIMFLVIPTISGIVMRMVSSMFAPEHVDAIYYRPLNASTSLVYTKFKLYELINRGAPQNIIPHWELVYSPSCKITDAIMINTVKNLSNEEVILTLKPQRNRLGVDRYMVRSRSFAAVVFPDEYVNLTNFPLNFNYSIRFPSEKRIRAYGNYEKNEEYWFTNIWYAIYREWRKGDLSGSIKSNYVGEGFAPLQLAVALNYVQLSRRNFSENMARGNFSEDMALYLRNFAFQRFVKRKTDYHHLRTNQKLMAAIFYIIHLSPFIYITNLLTHERRIMKHLQLCGVGMFTQMFSWILVILCCYAVTAVVFTAFLTVQISDSFLLSQIDLVQLLVVFMVYSTHMMFFSFCISSFISGAVQVLIMSTFLYVLTLLPYYFDSVHHYGIHGNSSQSFFFGNSAMGYMFRKFRYHQGIEIQSTWKSLLSASVNAENNDLRFLLLLASTLFCIVVYVIRNQFLVPTFGARRNSDFLSKSFWKRNRKGLILDEFKSDQQSDPSMVGAQTLNLRKIYRGKELVKNLNVKFLEDEIYVLFGSADSGIHTIFGILVGSIEPTSGGAWISGYNVVSNQKATRQIISVCSDEADVIFHNLSWRDHIRFYSMVRGVKDHYLDTEVQKYISYINPNPNKEVYPYLLSFSKRVKCAIILALSGNRKFVIMKEPSKYLDTLVSKEIWDILRKEKIGRTIVISSNDMEEVEAVGDNIGIVIDGELKMTGSPFTLRSQFGNGYNLTFVKKQHCRVSKISSVLERFIPTIEPPIETVSELIYYLPMKYSPEFKNIFQELERLTTPDQLGVEHFGVHLSSLEDVFMKMASHGKQNIGLDDVSSVKLLSIESLECCAQSNHRGCFLIFSQLKMAYCRKFLYLKRHWKSCMCIFIAAVAGNLFCNNLVSLSIIQFPNLKFDWGYFHENQFLLVNQSTWEVLSESMLQKALEGNDKPQISRINVTASEFEKMILDGKFADVLNNFLGGLIGNSEVIKIYFNVCLLHALPNIINTMVNTIAKMYVSPESSIVAYNHPIELKIRGQLDMDGMFNEQCAFSIQTISILFLSFFIILPIKENCIGLRFQQFMSGLRPSIYWMVHFHVDITIFMTVWVISLIVTHYAENAINLNYTSEIILLAFVIFLNASSALSYIYVFTKVFKNGFLCAMVYNFSWLTTGQVLLFIMLNLKKKEIPMRIWCSIYDCVVWLPSYASASALYKAIKQINIRVYCDEKCSRYGPDCTIEWLCNDHVESNICCYYDDIFNFDCEGILYEIITLILNTVIPMLLLNLSDGKSCKSIPEPREYFSKDYLDKDVRSEENLAQLCNKSTNEIVVLSASKEYNDGNKIAFNDLSFRISSGECFCILGDFGAGKGSLIRVLGTVEDLTSGSIFVRGLNVSTDYASVRKYIAFCPLEIFLLEEFTVNEHLNMFLDIIGFPSRKRKDFKNNFTSSLGLAQYLNKRVSLLKVGLKKKLSLALLLINCPKIIMLFMPTHTLDLIEKRQIWYFIQKMYQARKTVVFASNSVLECEALCSRLAIMVNGEFRCIGSLQKLKTRFSIGLVLNIKLRPTKKSLTFYSATSMENASFSTLGSEESVKVGIDDVHRLIRFLEAYFPNIQKREIYDRFVVLSIPNTKSRVTLSTVFELLESNLEEFNIEDYWVGQTTLEKLFVDFNTNDRNYGIGEKNKLV